MKRLLDFYADWCQPCKTMEPIVEALEKEFPEVEVKRINIEEEENIARGYGISSIPAFVIEQGDEELARLIGVQSKEALSKVLRD